MGRLSRGLVAGALQGAMAAVAALVGTSGHTPGAMVALVAGTTVLVVALEASAQHGDDREPASRYDRRLALITSVAMAMALLGGVAELAARDGGHLPLVCIGCALAVVGAMLRARAIATLGERFITEARAPDRLATAGVFAVVRHPSELGLLIIVAGLAIAAPGIATVAALLASLACSLVRTRREDRALAAAFGDVHAAYAQRVGSLLPHVLPRARRGAHAAR